VSIDGHKCFNCHREAAIFDRNLGAWVCEGNADCAISRNAPAVAAGTFVAKHDIVLGPIRDLKEHE
jgi:hypothetical protein